MKKYLAFLLALISVVDSTAQPLSNPETAAAQDENDNVIINRIEYFYRLKPLLDKFVWKGFDDPGAELPLVYYTDKDCYIAKPTEKFLRIYRPTLIYKKGRVSIYKTGLLDTTFFHMEAAMNFVDTGAYNYHSPFMNCSSYEIAKRHPEADINDNTNMEQWVTFIMHEYFHGFQFTHPAFLAHYKDSIYPVAGLTMRKIYDDNPSLKESIDKENDLLLRAIATESLTETIALVDSFFSIRTKRRETVKNSSGFDMGKYELFYETTEGTARYIEYGLINLSKNREPDKELARADTAYRASRYFRIYELENEPSMYLTSKTNYVYAIGFNMCRLADKLHLLYKNRLFKEPTLSLEEILYSFLNNSKKSL